MVSYSSVWKLPSTHNPLQPYFSVTHPLCTAGVTVTKFSFLLAVWVVTSFPLAYYSSTFSW